MRTKKVTVLETEFTISPLNVDQSEKYGDLPDAIVKAQAEDKPETLAMRAAFARQRAAEIVADGLNNAIPRVKTEIRGNGAAVVVLDSTEPTLTPWDAARVRAEMDPALMFSLQKEILDFSGVSAEAGAPGEAKAAAAS